MKNSFLYTITVLIWGSTWFAIEFQLGDVAVEVSLIYRFFLAGILVLTISKIRGMPLDFSLSQHFFIALLGLLNFSLNYLFLYEAQKYLSSAMTSIAFSMLLLVNIINTRLFFGKRVQLKTFVGATFGLSGIVILFWPEISQYETGARAYYGLAFVMFGVLVASLGNMVSVRNSNYNFPVFQTSGWAMLYGTGILLLFAYFRGSTFNMSFKADYLLSLTYLVIFGTVIAFYSYFYLLKNIGPEKASYSIVLFPFVSVILSSLFEGFEWTRYTIIGFLFVAVGNLLMLVPLSKIKPYYDKRTKFRKRVVLNCSEDCSVKPV